MIPALFLVFLAVVYRIATAIIVQGGGSAWLSNFAPLAAIALCGAIYFPRKYKFTVPFAALLASDIVLDRLLRGVALRPADSLPLFCLCTCWLDRARHQPARLA